jgi:hypothetical protein
VVLRGGHPQPRRAGTSDRLLVLIGFPAAEHYLGFDGHPSNIYVRTRNTPAAVNTVDALLGAQAGPENPSQVNVSQPSNALTAQADAAGAFDTLFLGLGAGGGSASAVYSDASGEVMSRRKP